MAYRKRWRPNKQDAIIFAKKMQEIEEFCIQKSRSSDSYYFTVNGKHYRVSNHSIEASNKAAYDEFGNLKRDKYHSDSRSGDVHASKTRIIEIYSNIIAGHTLDGRGNVIKEKEAT